MIHRQRPLTALCAILLMTGLAGTAPARAEDSTVAHAIAMHGDPKHGADFTHFDFANPDAPKGGTLIRAEIGSFDSLNPFIVTGDAAAGVSAYVFPTLMTRNWDEPFTMYGYLAEEIETPPDRSWVTFHLNPDARWHDGTPITVDDVVFSMETHREQGTPGKRQYYQRIETVQRVGAHAVRFNLSDDSDRETPLVLSLMPIFSKAYYTANTFDETSLEPPLGGGPYRIADVDPGRQLTLERVEDWWGAELPAFRGQFNFDTLRYDYYRDASIALQAFTAGDYNYRLDFNLERWATAYDFPAVQSGEVTLMDAPHGRAQGMRGFAFNARQPMFRDAQVREALTYAFDFEWVNRNYLRSQYRRIDSFFANSSMAAGGAPQGAELALLEPHRALVPASVFTAPPALPTTDGDGNIRSNLRRAGQLLDEAGWVVREGTRVHASTGEPLAFEILLRSASDERIAASFAENLKRLGVEARIRLVESAQYSARIETYEFDMIIHRWGVSLSPGNEQVNYWGSRFVNTPGSRNYAGVNDPVVDALAAEVANATDRDALEAAVRALDRVLRAGHYIIPLYFSDIDHIAYWGDLGYVDYQPLYGMISTVDAWWSND